MSRADETGSSGQLALEVPSDDARAGSPRTTRPPRTGLSRSCRSTPGWPTSTGRSSTPCPSRWQRQPSRARGSRSASRAVTSTGSCSSAPRPPSTSGGLSPLRRVVSPEAVLTPSVLRGARDVAARYAGTLGDVLRLGGSAPPRHGREGAGDGPTRAPATSRAPRPVVGAVCRWVGAAVPDHRWRGAGRVGAGAAIRGRRRRLARSPGGCRSGRRRGRSRCGARRAGPPGRGAGRRRPARGAGARPPRPADGRPGPAGPLHGIPQGPAGPRPGRRRHPGRGVRTRARPRVGGLVG